MSKKPDTVEQQHNEKEVRDLEVPKTDIADYAGTEARSNIDELRQRHFEEYQKREAADFKRAAEIATQRLADLERDGFANREAFDPAATADAIERSEEYDHYEHLAKDAPASSSKERTEQTISRRNTKKEQ